MSVFCFVLDFAGSPGHNPSHQVATSRIDGSAHDQKRHQSIAYGKREKARGFAGMMNPSTKLLGQSAAIRAVEEQIELAARSDAKVLITGESGVGKEIVSRRIHERSSRRRAPLVAINCAGFPDSLLESQLFGHEKGSFTDAHRDKTGWLQAAQGGTIFMDEVGEMSLRMQALLLRFLETGEIQRVGSDRPLPRLDVRVITATHQRLSDRVAEKTFREDLYYRLNVINISVPPLRERRADVPELLRHFLKLAAESNRIDPPGVTPDAMQHLNEYDWPGNVRELINLTERLVLRATNGRIDLDALPPEILGRQGQAGRHDTINARAEALFRQILTRRRSFWTEAYAPFMARDLNREEIRALIRLGLEYTHGSYTMLVAAFNMPPQDYKRFLTFLRKQRCHVAFQEFRVMSRASAVDGRDRPVAST
jgi:DNA-binding NtrC family response regulator